MPDEPTLQDTCNATLAIISRLSETIIELRQVTDRTRLIATESSELLSPRLRGFSNQSSSHQDAVSVSMAAGTFFVGCVERSDDEARDQRVIACAHRDWAQTATT